MRVKVNPGKKNLPLIVAALGGNAILQRGQKGNSSEQLKNIQKTASQLARLLKDGYKIVLTHGNGPQVGNIYIQNSLASSSVPQMPFDICSAESQGLIGYMMQQSLQNELIKNKLDIPVITLITQVLVNPNCPAFSNPTKPIGLFHNERESKLLMEKTNFIMKEDSNRGWRRVVSSPKPKAIIEKNIILELLGHNCLVIAAGGGGIPVINGKKGELIGVEAVIDKDLTASRLALDIKAEILLILTDVPHAAINYGKADQKNLNEITVKEIKKYLEAGHFKSGSMMPKVEAAVQFVENGGKKAIITSLNCALLALKGKTGTVIVSDKN